MYKYLLLLLCISNTAFTQIEFEKGYVIFDNGQKKEAWIKNVQWQNNPEQITYKLTENGPPQTAGIAKIKSFNINRQVKYERKTVKIDPLSYASSTLAKSSNPEYSLETLFLKVLIEGKATLYSYHDGNLKSFFYSLNDSLVKQLIYKEIKIDQRKTYQYRMFQQQLFNHLNCIGIPDNSFQHVSYAKNDLKRIFKSYNECFNVAFKEYEQKRKLKEYFHLKITSGANFSNSELSNNINNNIIQADFGNQFTVAAGVEIELSLPFHKNKWAVLFAPNYQYFNKKDDQLHQIASIDYQVIELPAGVRHFFYLNKQTKVFLNLTYNNYFDLNDSKIYNVAKNHTQSINFQRDINTTQSFGFGAGIDLRNFTAELRYNTYRGLIENDININTKYNLLNFVIGYRFF